MRSTNPGRYLIFFLIKFPFECRRNHVWVPMCNIGQHNVQMGSWSGDEDKGHARGEGHQALRKLADEA